MRAVALLLVVMMGMVGMSQADDSFPQPFSRALSVQSPPLSGSDVIILQNLIVRSPLVMISLQFNGNYDANTAAAVQQFQQGNGLVSDAVFDAQTASLLLDQCLGECLSFQFVCLLVRFVCEVCLVVYSLFGPAADGYKDDGSIPPGYLYKVYIPVYKNRSIETIATLFNSDLQVDRYDMCVVFRARA